MTQYGGSYPAAKQDPEPKVDERDEEIARLKAEKEQAERENARLSGRMDQFERDVERRFANNKQNEPSPDELVQAQQELEIPDEELLDPRTAPGAIRRIAEHQAKKIAAEESRSKDPLISGLASSAFEGNLDRLRSKEEFVDELEPYIREYFEDNPEEGTSPANVRRVYDQLVGMNYRELNKMGGNKQPVEDDDEGGEGVSASKNRFRQQSRVVDAPVRTASPSSRPGRGKKEVVLDEARQTVADTFRGLGVDMTPEEWAEIEGGKKYPKNVASDQQQDSRRKSRPLYEE